MTIINKLQSKEYEGEYGRRATNFQDPVAKFARNHLAKQKDRLKHTRTFLSKKKTELAPMSSSPEKFLQNKQQEASWGVMILFILIFTQQTLILRIQYKPSHFSGGIMRGPVLGALIGAAAFIGNMGLGLLKGALQPKRKRESMVALLIHQVLFVVTLLGIYEQVYVRELQIISFLLPLLSSLSIGTLMLSASDSMVDSVATKMLGVGSFATAQLWGQKITGKFLFSLLADNYNQDTAGLITGILLFSTGVVILLHSYVISHMGEVYTISEPNKKRERISYTKSCIRFFKKKSYLKFPPLFLMLLEALFLDIITSSGRFIFTRLTSENGNQFISDSRITTCEILMALGASITMQRFFTRRSQKRLSNEEKFVSNWKLWSRAHNYATCLRIFMILLVVTVLPISQHLEPIQPTPGLYTAKIKKWYVLTNGTNVKTNLYYSVVSSSEKMWLLVLTLFSLNAIVDIVSAVLLIVMLKNFADSSKKKKFTFAEIDGILRVFTYAPAAIPVIKHSASLSMFNSSPSSLKMTTTLILMVILYTIVNNWNLRALRRATRKIKVE